MDRQTGWIDWIAQLNEKTATRRHAESLMTAADHYRRCAAQGARRRKYDRERMAAHRRAVCNFVIDAVFALVVILSAVAAFAIAAS